MGALGPRGAADRSVVLAQHRLEVAAVLAAGVARGAVDAAAVPGQPVPGVGLDVLAEAQVEHLALERRLRLVVRARPADVAGEDRPDRHGPAGYPASAARMSSSASRGGGAAGRPQ